MQSIPVIPIQNPGQLPAALQHERDRHLEEIRRLAYTLYCQRGQVPGHESEDWRQAEVRLSACPVASTEENGSKVRIVTRLRLATPEHLHVTAFPREIFVKSGDPKVFERFPLPLEIEPASVEAALEKDLLTITARAHKA
jgi:HSP20 family molecular chaperone IbpA